MISRPREHATSTSFQRHRDLSRLSIHEGQAHVSRPPVRPPERLDSGAYIECCSGPSGRRIRIAPSKERRENLPVSSLDLWGKKELEGDEVLRAHLAAI